MTTILFIACIMVSVFFTILIATRMCYKNAITFWMLVFWTLGITGLITRFAGIW